VVEYPKVDITLVADKITEIKLRKYGGHDGLQNEHVIHLYTLVQIWLFILACYSMLFYDIHVSQMIFHFHFGVTKPLLKSKHGDLIKVDMYRGITLIPVISKLFEAVLLSLWKVLV